MFAITFSVDNKFALLVGAIYFSLNEKDYNPQTVIILMGMSNKELI